MLGLRESIMELERIEGAKGIPKASWRQKNRGRLEARPRHDADCNIDGQPQ